MKCLLPMLAAAEMTGCFSAPYLNRAEVSLVDPPSISSPVAHPARAAATVGLRLTVVDASDFESKIRTGHWANSRYGDYTVSWPPVVAGGDVRLITRIIDVWDGFSVLADYHVSANADPENPFDRHAVLAGIGITFPHTWGSLRFSPAIGRHAHHVAATEVRVEGSCIDTCTYHEREISENQSSLLLAWATTLWWPPELTGSPITPHFGYQYTRSHIPVASGAWTESLTLRRHAFEAGVRHVGRFATIGVTGARENMRHRSRGASYMKFRIEAERGFGRRARE